MNHPILTAAAAGVVLALAGCGGSTTPASANPTTNAAAGQSTSPAAQPSAKVKLPNLVGENGGIAQDKLSKLGLTNIQFGSGDPSASVVLLVTNWHVIKQEPKAGTKMNAGDLIVLTMKKNSSQ
jgi:beta-lactam-binding protein with PASTA domain